MRTRVSRLLAVLAMSTTLLTTGCGSSAGNVSFLSNDSADDRDPAKTPGTLCTASDPDFDEYRYAESVPHCRRRVTAGQKRTVGLSYGIDPAEFSNYQFDHFIPLAIGGSNANGNLWPLLTPVARRKAAFEQQLYNRISRGEISQAQAIEAIYNWE